MNKNTKTSRRLCVTLATVGVLLAPCQGIAQNLPANPWAQPTNQATPQQPVQQNYQQTMQTQQGTVNIVGVRPMYGSQPIQPVYEGGASNVWNTKQPQYTGQLTTWGKDVGQQVTAPEVNMHNILAITQHLRNMGYQIPSSFESKFKAAPAGIQKKVMAKLVELESNNDPFSKGAKFFLERAEMESGLSFENLFNNSMRLLTSK